MSFAPHAADGTVLAVAEKLPIKMLNDRLLVQIPKDEGSAARREAS
ncbi:MAG: hypothetical protein R2715_16345 [Ilumatobacteraceae bacterium]